jgi:hypothetical protein
MLIALISLSNDSTPIALLASRLLDVDRPSEHERLDLRTGIRLGRNRDVVAFELDRTQKSLASAFDFNAVSTDLDFGGSLACLTSFDGTLELLGILESLGNRVGISEYRTPPESFVLSMPGNEIVVCLFGFSNVITISLCNEIVLLSPSITDSYNDELSEPVFDVIICGGRVSGSNWNCSNGNMPSGWMAESNSSNKFLYVVVALRTNDESA